MLLNKIQTFMGWWGEGLSLGLPKFLGNLFRSVSPRLSMQILPDNRLLTRWKQDGKSTECGTFELDGDDFNFEKISRKHARQKKYLLELALDKHQVLHLQHVFPEAVQDNVKQVVGYQLDRLTPFSTDNAYFDAKVASHHRDKKEVLVDIYVTPKKAIDKCSDKLSALGVPSIDVFSTLDSKASLSHGESGLDVSQKIRWSRIPLYFFLAALIASLAAPILYKQRRLDQIDGALKQLQRNAATQLEVRDKMLDAKDALAFLEERRRQAPVMLDVVEKLSTEIPSHTWLQNMELQGRDVQIRGESNQALTLIDTLEESPHFAGVSFKSPVTRSKNSGKDKFHIQAQVETK